METARRCGPCGADHARRVRRRHELTDPEISDSPDLRNTYPPHCLRGTRGAREDPRDEAARPATPLAAAVPARAPRRNDPGPPRDPAPEEELRRLHEPEHRAAPRRPSTPDEIVVFGVATDVCNDAAIRGFLQRGRRVRFVEDAARGLDDATNRRLPGGLARPWRRVLHRAGGDRLPRLRDSPRPADETSA